MTFQRWLICVSSIALGGAALLFSVVATVDLYGLFRNTRGRHIPVYLDERASKYLLNRHYVPANFDSILIGSSTTSNWETSRVASLHLYNDSVDGGDATEERLLLNQGLKRAHYRVAIVLLHPYFTCMHSINDPNMNFRGWREALGSFNLLLAYRQMYRVEKLHMEPAAFWDGHKDLEEPARLPKQEALEYIYKIDPRGLADYQGLVSDLRSSGTKLVFVIPPMYQPMLEVNRSKLDEYRRQLHVEVPGDRVIDFNTDAYKAFRQVRENFSDGVHSTSQGAAAITEALNHSLQAMVGDSASQDASSLPQR